MDDYDIPLDASQVEAALLKVHDADATPQPGSSKMVTSGGVEFRISAESAARVAADDALDARVAVLENVPDTTESVDVYVFAPLDASIAASGLLYFMDSVVADASLSVSDTQPGNVLTLPAGTWVVEYAFQVRYSLNDGSPPQQVDIWVDGSPVVSETSSGTTYMLGQFLVTKSASWTLGIYWIEGDDSVAEVRGLSGPVFKLRKIA